MAAAMFTNLERKTGQTLESWMQVLPGHEGQQHGVLVKLLKKEFGLTYGYAPTLALFS